MASIRKRTWKTAAGESRTGFFVDFYDANGVRGRKLFATRGEAIDFRTSVEGQVRSGTFRADAGRITVKQAADLFLEHAKGRRDRGERMTAHTYEVYEGYVKNYICPAAERRKQKTRNGRQALSVEGIGAVKLGQLTAGRVGAFRDRLRSRSPTISWRSMSRARSR